MSANVVFEIFIRCAKGRDRIYFYKLRIRAHFHLLTDIAEGGFSTALWRFLTQLNVCILCSIYTNLQIIYRAVHMNPDNFLNCR